MNLSPFQSQTNSFWSCTEMHHSSRSVIIVISALPFGFIFSSDISPVKIIDIFDGDFFLKQCGLTMIMNLYDYLFQSKHIDRSLNRV